MTEKKDITFVKFDLKNQFSDLDKNRIYKAFHEVSRLVGGTQWFSISKRRLEKKRDVMRKKNRRDFYVFNASMIYFYIMLELDNPYFEVGGKLFLQKNGLPMGGLVSAGLAVIDSIYVEHFNRQQWNTSLVTSKWFRFRDDILAVIDHKCDKSDIEFLLLRLQEMYGPQLQVILEEFSYDHIQFLEYYIANSECGLKFWDRNKNVDWIYKHNKKVVRFPEHDAEHHNQIYMGIMIGGFRKAYRNSSTPELRIFSSLQMAQEWIEKGYPTKWIINAAYTANVNDPKDIKTWINWYKKKWNSGLASNCLFGTARESPH